MSSRSHTTSDRSLPKSLELDVRSTRSFGAISDSLDSLLDPFSVVLHNWKVFGNLESDGNSVLDMHEIALPKARRQGLRISRGI